jgi:hypothetical protein
MAPRSVRAGGAASSIGGPKNGKSGGARCAVTTVIKSGSKLSICVAPRASDRQRACGECSNCCDGCSNQRCDVCPTTIHKKLASTVDALPRVTRQSMCPLLEKRKASCRSRYLASFMRGPRLCASLSLYGSEATLAIFEAAYETEARRRLFGASRLARVILGLAGLSDVAD